MIDSKNKIREVVKMPENRCDRDGPRASAKRASKTISNPNTSGESIFHKLSELVLEIFLRGHMTEKNDF